MNIAEKRFSKRVASILLIVMMLMTLLPQTQAVFAESQRYTGEQGGNPYITMKDSATVKVSDIVTDTDIEDYWHNTISTAVDAAADLRFVFVPTGYSTNKPAESDIIANAMPHISIYKAADALTGKDPVASYDGGKGALELEQVRLGTSDASEYATVQLKIKGGTLNTNTDYALVFDKDLAIKKPETTIKQNIVFYFRTKAPATGFKLDKSSISTSIGQTETISAQYDNSDVDPGDVTWTSSNVNVASVSGGKVKAISEGTAIITASYQGKTAECTVKVGNIAYSMQGTGGNQVSMVEPDDITVLSEDDDRYLNSINSKFHDDSDVRFVFMMSAGMQQFNEENFISKGMDNIKVYDTYGGSIVAQSSPQSGQAGISYDGYDESKGIALKISRGALANGTYYLVMGKNLEGNNPAKTLGKDVVFRFSITDTQESIEPESISLDWNELTLTKGTEMNLKAEISPSDTTDKTVLWSSSDNSTVSVSEDGAVKALRAGSAVITAKTKNGRFSAECAVTVEESTISLSSQSLEMSRNEEQTLRAEVNGEKIKPEWTSSDPEVVAVDEKGAVKAVKSGHAAITATYSGARSICIINVTDSGVYGSQGNGGNTMLMKNPDNIFVRKVTSTGYYNGINTPLDGSSDIIFEFTMSAGMNNFGEDVFLQNSMPYITIWDENKENIIAQYSGGSGDLKFFGTHQTGENNNHGNKVTDGIYVGVDKGFLKAGRYVIVFGKEIRGRSANRKLGKDVEFTFNVKYFIDDLTLNLPQDGDTLEAAVRAKEVDDQTVADIEKLRIVTGEGYRLSEADFRFIREDMNTTLSRLDLSEAALDGNVIPAGALQGCTALEKLTLPADITEVKADAFRGCRNLETVKLTGGTPPSADSSAFEDTALRNIIVPYQYEDAYRASSPWKDWSIVVEVQRVTLNKNDITVEEGKSNSLTAEIFPDNATDKSLEWESSDEDIATVDKDGNVTGMKPGNTVITVKTSDGGYEASCKVKVIPPVPVITLNKATAEIYTTGDDSTVQLTARVTGTYVYTDEDVAWWSLDEDVATVDEFGLVTAAPGAGQDGKNKTYIFAQVGSTRKYCSVTVKEHTLTLSASEKSLLTTGTGNTATLRASLDGKTASGSAVTWSSSNTSVATVTRNTGIIKGVKAGTAVITAKAKGKEARCTVRVTALGTVRAKAASAAYNKVKVTWTGVSGAGGYMISRCSRSGAIQKSWNVSSSARSFTETGRTTGTTYYYKVCAYRTANGSRLSAAYSSAVSAKPVPAAVTGMKTAKSGSKRIRVSWRKVTGASGYTIYRSIKKSSGFKAAGTVKKGSTVSWRSSTLKKGTRYYFKVRAYRTTGGSKVYGPYSAVVSRTAK